MKHPKDVGDDSTLAIIFALRRAGYRILMPFGENPVTTSLLTTG